MSNQELKNIIFWFGKTFHDVITDEGWNIRIRDVMPLFNNESFHLSFYIYPPFDILKKDNSNTSPDFINNLKTYIEYAKEYGFTVTSEGEIVDFNKDKLTRNKHLLTASDLGLV